MAIRKPTLSVQEAKRLATGKSGDADDPASAAATSPAAALTAETRNVSLANEVTQLTAASPHPLVEMDMNGGTAPKAADAPQPVQDLAAPAPGPRPAPQAEAMNGRPLAPRPSEGGAPEASSSPQKKRVPSGPDRSGVMPPPAIRKKGIVLSAFTNARIQVFVSAFLPSPGVSSSFDALSLKYPVHKALQMILRRALDDFEVSLESGSYAKLPDTYPSEGRVIVQTSRIMPLELVEIARAHFDPLGFESARAFGLKLATAALAAFFARERMGR